MNTLEQLHNGQLAGTRKLTPRCGLTEFPREIFDLADSLEILDLSGNALTSLPDDLPQSEIAACLRAGNHPYLIPVVGTVPDHPAGVSAMVMELMDPAFHNLAGPPSLATCTRDVYADGTALS